VQELSSAASGDSEVGQGSGQLPVPPPTSVSLRFCADKPNNRFKIL
jgi:hypothetical protein